MKLQRCNLKSHHVKTSDSVGKFSLYNVPRELIDPRDPEIVKQYNLLIFEREAQRK